MTLYKTEVRLPESGVSDWIIHLPLDENNPDKLSVIELSYSNALETPVAMLITEDANGLACYDDMNYTLLRYDAEAELQAGIFTVCPELYPTIKLTVLIEQKQDYITIEIKREACDADCIIEDDDDLQSE
jgi:hypothetical protein